MRRRRSKQKKTLTTEERVALILLVTQLLEVLNSIFEFIRALFKR